MELKGNTQLLSQLKQQVEVRKSPVFRPWLGKAVYVNIITKRHNAQCSSLAHTSGQNSPFQSKTSSSLNRSKERVIAVTAQNALVDLALNPPQPNNSGYENSEYPFPPVTNEKLLIAPASQSDYAAGTSGEHDNGKKRVLCTECSKTYSSKSNLNEHMRTHTGDKPFKCQFCNDSFTFRCYLKRHTRIHTGKKPLKCQFCEFNAANNCSITFHMNRKHLIECKNLGLTTFECQQCELNPGSKLNLARHMIAKHQALPVKGKTCQLQQKKTNKTI